MEKENLNNSLEHIQVIQADLETEQSSNNPSTDRMYNLKRDLMQAYKEEKSFWSQKSREKWLFDWDGNTKYFHDSVKASRSKNFLKHLIDGNGNVQKAEPSKGEVASAYFTNLFTSTNPDNFEDIFYDFRPTITEEMNVVLIGKVSKEEIKETVFSIKATMTPKSDGMTGCFFQEYWDLIGDQLTTEIHEFFEKGTFPTEWNYTHLCLIPKIVDATKMSDLRPISLCSVIYRSISKILVRRLQPLLPQLVFFLPVCFCCREAHFR